MQSRERHQTAIAPFDLVDQTFDALDRVLRDGSDFNGGCSDFANLSLISAHYQMFARMDRDDIAKSVLIWISISPRECYLRHSKHIEDAMRFGTFPFFLTFMIGSAMTTHVTADVIGSAAGSCGPSGMSGSETQHVRFDAAGYGVVQEKLDSFSNDDPVEALEKTGAMGDFMQMSIVDLPLPMLAIHCSYDMYEATGCGGLPFLPKTVESASLEGEQLRFTTVSTEDGAQMQVDIQNRSFDSAQITLGGGQTVNTWVRESDGTERFAMASRSGDTITYIERPDCSGTGHRTRYNERGLLSTNDFSWTSVKEQSFKYSYEICIFQGPNTGCRQGSL